MIRKHGNRQRHGSSSRRMCGWMWMAPLLVTSVAFAQSEKEKTQEKTHPYDIRLSELLAAPKELGPGWTGPKGVMVDSFKEELELEQASSTIERLSAYQLGPMGVVGMVDVTYRKSEADGLERTVALRVYLFSSPQKCDTWWKRKLEHPGWEEFYVKIGGKPHRTVDRVAANKRYVSFDNVWMTAFQVDEGKDYRRLLDLLIKKIESKKPKKKGAPDEE